MILMFTYLFFQNPFKENPYKTTREITFRIDGTHGVH